jgi:hypothetical protein
MAEAAAPGRGQALWRYHASLTFAAAKTIWELGRSAMAVSAGDALGEEYRAWPMPSLYYCSPDSTPKATQEYLRRYAIANVAFSGGHWPMVESPEETDARKSKFSRPPILRSLRNRVRRSRRLRERRGPGELKLRRPDRTIGRDRA